MEPLAGARVLPVSAHDLTHGWDPEESWSFLDAIDKYAQAHGGVPARATLPGWGGMRSLEDGTVDVIVELWTCTRRSTFGSSTSREEPQDKVAALWVAVEGRAPVVVRIEKAHLHVREPTASGSYWATYDLGTVVVPVGEADGR